MLLLLSLIGHVAQSKGGKYALLLAERGYFDLGADQTLQRVAGLAMREVNTVSNEKTDGDGLRGVEQGGSEIMGTQSKIMGRDVDGRGYRGLILTALGVLRAPAGKGRGRGGLA